MAMSNNPDSSSSLPADSPAPPAETPEARKHRLLTSKRTRQAIARIARGHEVRGDDVADIVQATVAEAWRATLPDDDEEARRYINGIATNLCCGHMRVAIEEEQIVSQYVENPDPSKGETATPISSAPPPFEKRDALDKLLEAGHAQFPKGFPGYIDGKTGKATAEEVALKRGVTPGHVRKEWWDIGNFMEKRGRKLGLLLVATLILLVFGLPMSHWLERPLDGRDMSDYRAAHRPTPPDAATLRQRAKDAFTAGNWQACIDDLDAAGKKDPLGQTMELELLRVAAERNARKIPIEQDVDGDAKPPLYPPPHR